LIDARDEGLSAELIVATRQKQWSLFPQRQSEGCGQVGFRSLRECIPILIHPGFTPVVKVTFSRP